MNSRGDRLLPHPCRLPYQLIRRRALKISLRESVPCLSSLQGVARFLGFYILHIGLWARMNVHLCKSIVKLSLDIIRKLLSVFGLRGHESALADEFLLLTYSNVVSAALR